MFYETGEHKENHTKTGKYYWQNAKSGVIRAKYNLRILVDEI